MKKVYPYSINDVEPLNSTHIMVHFDSYAETALDLHSQQIPLAIGNAPGLSYEGAIELVEA